MRTLLITLLLGFSVGLQAQSYESRIHFAVQIGDTAQLHQLILLDYTKLLGTALEIDEENIRFLVRSATEPSIIPLRELRFLGVFNLGGSSSVSRRAARLFNRSGAGPGFTDLTYERTALPFHANGRVKVINLLYAVTEWNLNDHVQVGAGIAGPLGILFTGRLRHSLSEDIHVGLSGQALYPPFAQFNSEFILVGDLTTMFTFGNENRFLNLGTGLLFNTDDFEDNIVNYRFGIGGKIGRRVHLYAEALAILEEFNRFTGGSFRELRLIPSLNVAVGARRHRWRFGLATVYLDEDNFFPPPLPYVGYSYYW